MLKIGDASIASNVLLAPLSGCSDLAFRLISREHGARFCFFEMLDSSSLVHHRQRSLEILRTNANDIPIAAQILGNNPRMMQQAAQIITDHVKISFLDINCACPAKKITKKKAGAYLLEDTATLYRVIDALVPTVSVPVTVKIRIGYGIHDTDLIVKIAQECQAHGIAAIFVHGRTRAEKYTGTIDYEAIRAIKQAVRIPVIGSGNVLSGELAMRMFHQTDCDGILVARGAIGNPWIFEQIEAYRRGTPQGEAAEFSLRKTVILRHLGYVDSFIDSSRPSKMGHLRKVALWYIKHFPLAARMRSAISHAQTLGEIIDLIDSV